ncbi:hypothetical protein [Myxococcus sp. AS-1-15]|uniref:hypothetical protein n=1 Tax=Myxococcus TaxID=32 RepID=UPI001CC0BAE0|nr:hypothetical protein [Myxococcus sp. AS-1-15]MBZ4402178.1 hypothetical protein [Myxococcus sp. AS-1-15]BDT34881.1 hypothetical protein MFMH1_45500 [Myxococcus sp. MH1]
MSDTRVGATLTYTGTATPPTPAQVPVDPAGLVVALEVPAGVVLLRASLALRAPGDDVTVNLIPTATLATSTGQNVVDASQAITWLSLDWGSRRPLSSMELTLPASPTQTAKKGRLSIAEGGAWYPPTPSDTVGVNAVEPLPGIFASRLLVEFVEANNSHPPLGTPKTLSATKLASLTLRAPARPPDLTASAGTGSGALFFHQALPMNARQELVMEDVLTQALQRAWPANLEAGRVTVSLRASGLGMFDRVRLALDTLDDIRRFSDGADERTLALDTDGTAIASVSVPRDRALSEVRFHVRHALRDEHLPLTPRPPARPSRAHRCGSGRSAAQAFIASRAPGALTAVDLHLRPGTRQVTGTVALHADVHDRPDEAPLPGSAVPLLLEASGPPPWPARWVSFTLPKPLALNKGRWWVVVTTDEGEVLWSLIEPASGTPEPGAVTPDTTLHRTEPTGPWLPRDSELPGEAPGAAPLWACARPRLRPIVPVPPPPPRLQLRWGTKVLDVTPDGDGVVHLDAQALAVLTPPGGTGEAPPLELIVQSRVAGEVTLSGLQVVIPRQETYALFPR